MQLKMGVEIGGFVFNKDNTPLDHMEFHDMFIEWIESHNLTFGGITAAVDIDGERIKEDTNGTTV